MIPQTTLHQVRRLLAGVQTWVDPVSYKASRFAYGCSPEFLSVMGLPLGSEPSHIDLLVAIAQRLRHPRRYLELGVSFGKTLYCLAKLFPGEEVYGVDWEAINPPLNQLLGGGRSDQVPRSEFEVDGKRVVYLEMDAMDPQSWELLRGVECELIFSDAFHSGDAIRQQYELMRRCDVINPDEFFILWDDIDYTNNPDMVAAFKDISADLVTSLGLQPSHAFMLEINGWVGEHEQPHNMGVVNNMGITREMLHLPLHPVSRIDFNPLGQRLAFLRPSGIDPDGWLQQSASFTLPKGAALQAIALDFEFYAGVPNFDLFVDGVSTGRRSFAGARCRVELGGVSGERDTLVDLQFDQTWVISDLDTRARSGRLSSIELKP